LRRERAVLEQLHADERLGEWRVLLPRWRPAEGDPRLVLESILPGSDDASLLRQTPAGALELARLGLGAVRPLHTRTAEEHVVGEAELARWFEPPLQLLAVLHPSGLVPRHQRAAVELVTQRLRTATAGRRLTLSWAHGDYTPGNLLVDPGRGVVTGIVDWSEAAADCSPVLDAVLWIAAMHCQLSGEQLGSLVSRMLRGHTRSGADARAAARRGCEAESLTRSRRPARVWALLSGLLDSSAAGVGAGELDVADALLWAWLDHVTRNLSKSPRYLRSRLWWMGNVDAVLRTVCELGAGATSDARELGAGAASDAREIGAGTAGDARGLGGGTAGGGGHGCSRRQGGSPQRRAATAANLWTDGMNEAEVADARLWKGQRCRHEMS
jgi:hypothetical protein